MSWSGFSGLVIVLFSSRTSLTRPALSAEKVIMTKIIDSIIRLERIWKL